VACVSVPNIRDFWVGAALEGSLLKVMDVQDLDLDN